MQSVTLQVSPCGDLKHPQSHQVGQLLMRREGSGSQHSERIPPTLHNTSSRHSPYSSSPSKETLQTLLKDRHWGSLHPSHSTYNFQMKETTEADPKGPSSSLST